MKRSFTVLSMILLVNCSKEVVKEPKSINSNTSSNSAARQRFTSSMPVDYTQFNQCTGEYIHVTGFWNYTVTWDTLDNSINYTYHFRYDDVTAIGLTSGTKYQGNGHVTEHDQFVWDGQSYQLKRSHVTNKIIFTSRGGNNNFSSYAYYHFKVGDDGALMIDRSRFEPGYCQ